MIVIIDLGFTKVTVTGMSGDTKSHKKATRTLNEKLILSSIRKPDPA